MFLYSPYSKPLEKNMLMCIIGISQFQLRNPSRKAIEEWSTLKYFALKGKRTRDFASSAFLRQIITILMHLEIVYLNKCLISKYLIKLYLKYSLFKLTQFPLLYNFQLHFERNGAIKNAVAIHFYTDKAVV